MVKITSGLHKIFNKTLTKRPHPNLLRTQPECVKNAKSNLTCRGSLARRQLSFECTLPSKIKTPLANNSPKFHNTSQAMKETENTFSSQMGHISSVRNTRNSHQVDRINLLKKCGAKSLDRSYKPGRKTPLWL
jgi:hypothetical protein